MKPDKYVSVEYARVHIERRKNYYSMSKTYHTVKVPCPMHCPDCGVKEFCRAAIDAHRKLQDE